MKLRCLNWRDLSATLTPKSGCFYSVRKKTEQDSSTLWNTFIYISMEKIHHFYWENSRDLCGHGFNNYVRHYRRVIMLNDGGIDFTISIYFTMFHGKTHIISTGPWFQWQTVNVITNSGSPGSVSGSGGSGCNGL